MFLLLLTSCTTIHYAEWDGLPKTGEWRTDLAVGDVDNDGFLDIAGLARKGPTGIWLNKETWKESTQGMPEKMQCGVGVEFGDVNNDGNLDVALGQHCGGAAVYLGDGKGNWKNHSKGLSTENVNPIALADFDEDGLLDLVTLGAFLEGFRVYKNMNNSWKEVNTTLPKGITATSYQIVAEDINNDGKTDILATGGKIHVYLNKGNYSFEDKSLGDSFYTFIAAADTDNDGQKEIAANNMQQLEIYEQGKLYRNISCGKGGVSFANVNDDKNIDLIASCAGQIKIFAGPYFEEIYSIKTNGTPYGLKAADLNNDGKVDIVAAFDNGIKIYKKV